MIRCVLFDLDGVIRHFDPEHATNTERRHGLRPGVLQRTAFRPGLIEAVTTGRMSRAEWGVSIGHEVGSPQAATDWLADPGTVDAEMLALVAELRARGLLAAILTNGTDTVAAELAELAIDTEFDAIFNSADIGVAKPDPAAFRHVCDTLQLRPQEIFFTDDAPSKLAGAHELNMTAEPFVDVATLRAQLEKIL